MAYLRIFVFLLAICFVTGCSSYQPVKNVWKSTKGMWNTYVSVPGHVDYDDKGDLPPQAKELAQRMKGVDYELARLERTMQNADRSPTQQWLDMVFNSFPWLSGFAGIKYDGQILGQEPENFLKQLDFNPLLYEDKHQNSRALRADVQPSPMGPEIMLATPLYDGVDFLGIVTAFFDMRNLMKYSSDPDGIVVLCPTALLWPGKYDFAATPMAGVDWDKVVRESSVGTCSNATGSFFYQVRYFGNLPLIFAVPEKGDFPLGNGSLEQGLAYFPAEREKVPPPPVPESMKEREKSAVQFGHSEEMENQPQQMAEQQEAATQTAQEGTSAQQAVRQATSSHEIEPGSNRSVLLQGKRGSNRASRVQERELEGENVPVEHVERQQARRPMPQENFETEGVMAAPESAPVQIRRPSPFGPRTEEQKQTQEYKRPSPFGPREATPTQGAESGSQTEAAGTDTGAQQSPEQQLAVESDQTGESSDSGGTRETAPAEADQTDNKEFHRPATLPGGRPSPFGPRN